MSKTCTDHGKETYMSFSKDKCCASCFSAVEEIIEIEKKVEKIVFLETSDDYRVLKGDKVLVCNNKYAEDYAYTMTTRAYRKLLRENYPINLQYAWTTDRS